MNDEKGKCILLTCPSFARQQRLLNQMYDMMGALHGCCIVKFDSSDL